MGNALDPRSPIQRTLAAAGRLRDLEKFKHSSSPVSGLGKHGPAEPKKSMVERKIKNTYRSPKTINIIRLATIASKLYIIV
jgi:hypothetical protein